MTPTTNHRYATPSSGEIGYSTENRKSTWLTNKQGDFRWEKTGISCGDCQLHGNLFSFVHGFRLRIPKHSVFIIFFWIPVDTMLWLNAGSMLVQRRRRWANIKLALAHSAHTSRLLRLTLFVANLFPLAYGFHPILKKPCYTCQLSSSSNDSWVFEERLALLHIRERGRLYKCRSSGTQTGYPRVLCRQYYQWAILAPILCILNNGNLHSLLNCCKYLYRKKNCAISRKLDFIHTMSLTPQSIPLLYYTCYSLLQIAPITAVWPFKY